MTLRLSPTRSSGGLALLSAAALSAGCARRAPSPAPSPAATPARATVAAPVPLVVENHNRANVVLYAYRGSLRQRLGTVTAGATQQFVIPAHVAGDAGGFVLVADPIGGDPPGRTDVLHVYAGQRLVWTLESNLARSAIGIYQQ